MTIQTTIDNLHALRLNGMAGALQQQLEQPSFTGLGFETRFALLVDAESSFRDTQRLNRLLKNAKLKFNAQPESIEYRQGRGLDREQIASLLNCEWIERQQNLMITGPTGTGKTWLSCMFGVQAARRGVSVLYKRSGRLLEEMGIAHSDGSIAKLRSQLAKAKLLILDDFGLAPLGQQGRNDLLEILDDRVGTGATVMVGQMPVKDWHAFINDGPVADAILDRLVHSSHRITMTGGSMRKREK